MISIIVCTYNRSPVLRRMLDSFYKQEYLEDIKYELLIVDNNSKDETKLLASEYIHDPACKYIFEPRQGLSVARNRGVDESKGEIIAFLDDDVIVDKHWLKNLEECYLETKADAVGGRAYLIMEKEPPDWLGPAFKNILSEVELGNDRQFPANGEGLYGLNLSFRRSVLTDAGKFDEKLGRTGSQLLGAEEAVLLKKVYLQKKLIVYEPKAVVGHIIGADRMEWGYFLRLAIDNGKTKNLKEPKSGLPWQILRVARSLLNYAMSVGIFVFKNKSNLSNYEKRWANWMLESQKSHFISRWKSLLNAI